MKKQPSQIDFNEQFGAFVKKKRLQMGWTQAELASKLGNNYQNISRLERGEISPTLFWCYRLAEAFEMELVAFLKDFQKLNRRHF